MSETKKYFINTIGIEHNRKTYRPGDEIELTDKEAQPLRKYLTPVAEPKPAAEEPTVLAEEPAEADPDPEPETIPEAESEPGENPEPEAEQGTESTQDKPKKNRGGKKS